MLLSSRASHRATRRLGPPLSHLIHYGLLGQCHHLACVGPACATETASAAAACDTQPTGQRRAWGRGAALELQTLWVLQWYCREQGGAQQQGAQAGLAPRHAAQPQDHPDSEQQQDIQDEDCFMLWVKSPQRTSTIQMATLLSMVQAATGNHVGVHDLVCGRRPC